jgi:Ca2+-binding EF-hand superfamily protein
MARVALPCFTDQQLRSFQKEFIACDSRKTGKLKPDEFHTALSHLGVIPTKEEFRAMLVEIGSDGIDLRNFLTVIYYFVRGADKPAELQRALSVFDDDQDGRLSVEVVTDILKGLRRPVPDERIATIVQALGASGSISIAELIQELRPN